jgi:hypothetical protein
MAQPKRPSIKGQGASMFFQGGSSELQRVKEKDEDEERVMVTIYLPPKVAKRLDAEWLDRKKEDRKAQKSHVVTEALEAYFQQLDG